jgi:hypothetical protein
MANHVDNYITCEGSKKTMKIWKLLFSSYGETLQRPSYHGDGVINIWEYKEIQKHPFMGEGYDDHTNWRRWNDKNIGAKWAHIEEADEDSVRIVSAWSPVHAYVQKLYEYLYETDKTVTIRHTYEDEFRNFLGVMEWRDLEDFWAELSDEDIEDVMAAKFKGEEKKEEFEYHEYHDATECVPAEWLDDWVYDWMDSAVLGEKL